MKIKIISDGYVNGTKVVNAETNEPIEWISDVTWEVDYSTFITKATFTIINPEVDISSNFNFINKEFNKDSQTFDEKKEELYCHVSSANKPANIKIISNNKIIGGVEKLTWKASAPDNTVGGNGSKFKLQD